MPVERHNLPHPVNVFIGREAETDEVRRLLERARLVTLAGAGGMGKTAWRSGWRPISSPTASMPPGWSNSDRWPTRRWRRAVAEAVGARETPGQPAIASLTTTLRAGRTLLVLDNCEHLMDACAELAQRLLEGCPDLRILATSREPLGAPGEIAWRVPPLAPPAENDGATWTAITASPAVRLFAERARAVRREFALAEAAASAAAAICWRLDGIPLAIELAAARAPLLSPEELAARLDDRFRLLTGGRRSGPIRHRTLRAAIDWSYDLLDSQAQRCFERLSVFVGGFTLEGAEAVCAGDGIEPAAMIDLLAGLVDRSLVLADPRDGTEPTRYRLLETLRAYGGERLAERGAVERTRERHARWLLAQAERANLAFHGPEQGCWLRWAEREHDNARAAFAWAVERGTHRSRGAVGGRVRLAVPRSSALERRVRLGATPARAAEPGADAGARPIAAQRRHPARDLQRRSDFEPSVRRSRTRPTMDRGMPGDWRPAGRRRIAARQPRLHPPASGIRPARRGRARGKRRRRARHGATNRPRRGNPPHPRCDGPARLASGRPRRRRPRAARSDRVGAR